MPIKLGATNIKPPYSRVYLGNNLIYKKGPIDKVFTACIFPTEWTEIEARETYTATNEYGTWNIASRIARTTSYIPSLAFDRDESTSYSVSTTGSNNYIEIESPILIKPTKIFLKYKNLKSTTEFQGYNPETEEWETLYTLTASSSDISDNVSITTDNFYTKFRVYESGRYTSTPNIYEIQVTEGVTRQVIT